MRKIKEKVEKWIHGLMLTRQEKIRIGLILILTVIMALSLQLWDNKPLSGILLRNTYGEGDRFVELQARSEDGNEVDIEIEVWEQTYKAEELAEAFTEALESMSVLLLGENESYENIIYNLNFVDEIQGTGIEVTWQWEPYEVFNIEGEIQSEHVDKNGSVVEVVGTLSYGEEERTFIQTLCVYPELEEDAEMFLASLEEEIAESQEETKSEVALVLPEVVEGLGITWYASASYRGGAVLLLGCAVILLLLWEKEDKKRKIKEQRKKQMESDYAAVIHTFALYLGAGMTAKNVWKRMVQDSDEHRHIYGEMRRTYYEMCNGISEVECYEKFAKRCEIRCYQRFGLLLSQNVRKGTKGLTALLEREALEAFAERKARARQEGEKAGTKLLMPMFLMLVVVLIIIIVPAFVSIQI
ncbi:MAG: secretion protein F [Eubacteriales bacterium]